MTDRTVTCQADGSVVGTLPWHGPEVADDLVAAARAALPSWRGAAPHVRAAALADAARDLEGQVGTLGAVHAAESGKVLRQARGEVAGAAELTAANAELARMWGGTLAPTGAVPRSQRDLTVVERVPLGVVVCVIPFNFPVELTVEKAAAALAAGNTVIVKPPPQNPLATAAVVAVLQAHLPAGVLQLAPGGTDLSAALCAHSGVDAVSLTGSVGAGVAVAGATAATLRPLHLELGGNAGAIVLPGADLDLVAREVLAGRLLANGQACAATKRIVVVGDRTAELVDRLDALLDDVVVGDAREEASDVGPLIDAGAAARVADQVGAAVAQGAVLARGDGTADGPWFAPTILTDVPSDADVAVDGEIFGPVFTVIPAVDAEEAVAIVNASSLGLTGAVFDADWPRAFAVAQQLDVGGVVVNGSTNYRPPVVPFGGVGMAGSGREGIGFTLEELSRTRFIALKNLRPEPEDPWRVA